MIFRSYDIRGKVPRELNPPIATQVGAAFASEVLAQGWGDQVIVGWDNRPSSPELAAALLEGITSTGLHGLSLGEVATPMLYHASVTQGSAPAIMITGSHLPPDRNGFKMTVGLKPFFGEQIQGLRQRIADEDYAQGSGSLRQLQNHAASYCEDLLNRFDPAEKPLKIVVDAGNGMAGPYVPKLLRSLGHEVIELYCEPDGNYPNHPADPFEEANVAELKAKVQECRADLGLAFDGDADRLGVIGGQGEFHAVDRVMVLLVRDVLARLPGATIITDPLVSQVLTDAIKEAGGTALMWKSGHSNIKTKMQEVGAALAIETSGHVFIADGYYGYDDGIYTALRLVDLLSRSDAEPLARHMALLPELFTTPQYRPACMEAQKQVVIDAIAVAFSMYRVNRVDGVRVELPGGWFIVRASNTEPRLSLRFEANHERLLRQMVMKVEDLLKAHGIRLKE